MSTRPGQPAAQRSAEGPQLGSLRPCWRPTAQATGWSTADPRDSWTAAWTWTWEASALTNALPVRRMGLPVGGGAAAPAAYVRAVGLAVERLEQTYVRITDEAACQRYDYAAPAFDFAARLVYDESGLVLDYPGIAVRAG